MHRERKFQPSFSKESLGLTKMRINPKRALARFKCPVPVQSGRKCNSCLTPPRICPCWAQAGRDITLRQELCCTTAHCLDPMDDIAIIFNDLVRAVRQGFCRRAPLRLQASLGPRPSFSLPAGGSEDRAPNGYEDGSQQKRTR